MVTALAAGCLDYGSDSDGDKQDYTYRVNNVAPDPHSYRIRIGSGGGSWFHEESFNLDAETGGEEVPIDEIPARIFVRIDSNEEREFPWPASTSDLGNAAQRADIWYEPVVFDQIMIFSDR